MAWLGLRPGCRHVGRMPRAQPGPRSPYLVPLLGQAISLPVWGRLDALAFPKPSRDLVSVSFLLLVGRRGNPGTAGQSPAPGS